MVALAAGATRGEGRSDDSAAQDPWSRRLVDRACSPADWSVSDLKVRPLMDITDSLARVLGTMSCDQRPQAAKEAVDVTEKKRNGGQSPFSPRIWMPSHGLDDSH